MCKIGLVIVNKLAIFDGESSGMVPAPLRSSMFGITLACESAKSEQALGMPKPVGIRLLSSPDNFLSYSMNFLVFFGNVFFF